MKAHFEKKHILKMKAHSKTHFENENMFLEKWQVILKHPKVHLPPAKQQAG